MYTLESCDIKLTSSTGEVITVNAANVKIEFEEEVFEPMPEFSRVVNHRVVLNRELIIRCGNGKLSVGTPSVHSARKEGVRVIRFGKGGDTDGKRSERKSR